ncbi:uncharacterized protein AMSG_08496 [Thecamonas trahens ATCC 50062]|uniref:Uncharacterized protein n=1 Tax=Thecamonas trahens ATCC 50062 TaxID=461836 RepID=A0A0L0DK17_THETB|nr:hypothetical protein AMSG_08496 [Thecamonas trahens ATCC 50062]KNC52627.1 hypothetical protein AMSG_08496 [Thecamonas trahens ATCC 50062]|eukprot:XP_013755183.1 hypothetical protein AMSG_08496 [Thecamonas trahens ATCC 50062]
MFPPELAENDPPCLLGQISAVEANQCAALASLAAAPMSPPHPLLDGWGEMDAQLVRHAPGGRWLLASLRPASHASTAAASRKRAKTAAAPSPGCMALVSSTEGAPASTSRSDSAYPKALSLKEAGNTAYGHGSYQDAAIAYTRALALLSDTIEHLPLRAIAYNNRAAAFIQLYQFDQARADAEAVLRIDATNPKALWRHGIACEFSGDLHAALDSYAAVASTLPSHPHVHDAVARVQSRLQPPSGRAPTPPAGPVSMELTSPPPGATSMLAPKHSRKRRFDDLDMDTL